MLEENNPSPAEESKSVQFHYAHEFRIGDEIYAGMYKDGRRHGVGTLIEMRRGEEFVYEGKQNQP